MATRTLFRDTKKPYMLHIDYKYIRHVHMWSLLAVSLVSNIAAFYLIIKHSNPVVGAYKYILCSFVILNATFAIASAMADITVHVEGSLVVLVGTEMIDDEQISIGIIHLYVFFYFENIILITGQILHRYLMVCRRIRFDRVMLYGVLILLSSFAILGVWMVLFIRSTKTTEECVFKIDRLFYESPHFSSHCDELLPQIEKEHNLADASFVTIQFRVKDPIRHIVEANPAFVHLVWALIVLLGLSTFIIAICTILIYRKVKKDLRFVDDACHAQILMALCIQAVVPLSLLHLPLFVCSALSMWKQSMETTFNVLPYMTAWYPTLQAIGLIYSVSSYRDAFNQIFLKPCKKRIFRQTTRVDQC